MSESQALRELLFAVRQHPAFRELLEGPGGPEAKEFRPGAGPEAEQWADHIFRSGRRRQHEAWRQFLIGETSQQEKP